MTPFVTEAIWHDVALKLALTAQNLLERPYPQATDFERNDQAQKDVEALTDLIAQFRTFRSENQISPAKIISIYFGILL